VFVPNGESKKTENSKLSYSRRGNSRIIIGFFYLFRKLGTGGARQRRFMEKMVTAGVFLLERQPWKIYSSFGGRGGREIGLRGVKNFYTPGVQRRADTKYVRLGETTQRK
jgi:hypothetical protein